MKNGEELKIACINTQLFVRSEFCGRPCHAMPYTTYWVCDQLQEFHPYAVN
jgi:hypothetical protein